MCKHGFMKIKLKYLRIINIMCNCKNQNVNKIMKFHIESFE